MELTYNYVGDETPEERLRNKLQPLFYLVQALKRGEDREQLQDIIDACDNTLDDIRTHLSDIKPFYSIKGEKEEFNQNNTGIDA